MKIKLSELNPNPFKKHINDGKLNQDRVEILKESIDHGTLPEHFFARKNNGHYEVTSGHHRIEALKQIKGNSYPVDVTVVDFIDEQMAIDMIRENLAQRSDDFREEKDSIILAEKLLKERVERKGALHSKTHGGDRRSQECGSRQIAKFLSKKGKMISHNKVATIKKIIDKIHPDIQAEIEHSINQHDAENGSISKSIALELIIIEDKEEQKALIEIIKKSDRGHKYWRKYLPIYKQAPEDIKQQVRQGELDIADVEDAITIQELQKESGSRFVFLPNFSSQIRQFDRNVMKLEEQVSLFKDIFHSPQFKERYNILKTRQKEKLNIAILDIHKRIKQCYDEIEFFMSQLENETVLLEGKHA